MKRKIRSDGYVLIYVPNHPKAAGGYVLEHRYIMEQKIGRYLKSDETVHHKDENKQNNSPDNLEIVSNSEHARRHGLTRGRQYVKLRCPECKAEFEIPKNESYLLKHNKYGCTCCCRKCRGRFYRKIQLYGLTDEIKKSINDCFIGEFKKYKIDELGQSSGN